MRKNKSLFLTLAVSILGVFATAVSTFAWFQITYDKNEVVPGNSGVTGQANVDIDEVKGYKYAWDETGAGEGSTGRVITNPDTSATTLSSNYGNSDQDAITSLDNPAEGVGYYIIFKNAENR